MIEASSPPDLWRREWRLPVPVGEREEWELVIEGDEERRRLKRERLCVVGDVVVGGGEVCLLEKKPVLCVCTGAGGGEGSRRDPKRGMVCIVVVVGLV